MLVPTFRTSQVSHYQFWEFEEIGLARALREERTPLEKPLGAALPEG